MFAQAFFLYDKNTYNVKNRINFIKYNGIVKMHRIYDRIFAKMTVEIVLTEQTNGAIIKTQKHNKC